MISESILPRSSWVADIKSALAHSPVVSLLGPRQCGKTFLAKPFAEKPANYFDLHALVDRARLEDSNYRVLDGLEGVVVVDEVQRAPQLFEKLRVLADRPGSRTRFLITGSASPGIVRGVSESLAGRARLLQMRRVHCRGNWLGSMAGPLVARRVSPSFSAVERPLVHVAAGLHQSIP
jgi:uncharacterized protein